MFDLLYAAAVGDAGGVEHCLRRAEKSGFLWGDVSRTCARGRTALHLAVIGGHDRAVDLLLQAGAAVDAQDHDGCTAAMFAARENQPAILGKLLDAGARLALRARDGSGALHRAAAEGHEGVVALLVEAGCSPNVLDVVGATPLLQACARGHLGAAKLLIAAGAKVNTGNSHASGSTPLHAATQCAHLELVRLLLQHGALANKGDKDGNTALHVCAALDCSQRTCQAARQIAALLLAAPKVDASARNRAGQTCADGAKDPEMKRMIREAISGRLPPAPPASSRRRTEPAPPLTTTHPSIPGHTWAQAPAKGAQWQGVSLAPAPGPAVEPPEADAHPPSPAPTATCALDRAYEVVPPWALDGDHEEFTARIRRCDQIVHERRLWELHRTAPLRPASAHRRAKDLQPADSAWFDTSSSLLRDYPPRRAWGRYAP